mgnify:CR=1 FL=1|tara:strand:+ start:2310 stop:3077 length:768 start_codon:yes stop_codon:yes gene_type:complete
MGGGGLSTAINPIGSITSSVFGGSKRSGGYSAPGTSANYRPGGEMVQSQTPGGYQAISGGVNRYGEVRPDQILLRGEDGGLDPRFESTMGDSFQALKDKGMTVGDTKSAMLARQAQDQMRAADVDKMRAMQSSGVTQGMRNLAMRGGVATGSRERLVKDATKTGMRGMQGIGRENRMANLAISQQDEAMKNQLLGQAGGVEQGIQGQNIKMLAQDIAAQNMAAQNLYGEDMKALGAIETGKAQASAGKSSGGLFK